MHGYTKQSGEFFIGFERFLSIGITLEELWDEYLKIGTHGQNCPHAHSNFKLIFLDDEKFNHA
jgi:hypothetical protein